MCIFYFGLPGNPPAPACQGPPGWEAEKNWFLNHLCFIIFFSIQLAVDQSLAVFNDQSAVDESAVDQSAVCWSASTRQPCTSHQVRVLNLWCLWWDTETHWSSNQSPITPNRQHRVSRSTKVFKVASKQIPEIIIFMRKSTRMKPNEHIIFYNMDWEVGTSGISRCSDQKSTKIIPASQTCFLMLQMTEIIHKLFKMESKWGTQNPSKIVWTHPGTFQGPSECVWAPLNHQNENKMVARTYKWSQNDHPRTLKANENQQIPISSYIQTVLYCLHCSLDFNPANLSLRLVANLSNPANPFRLLIRNQPVAWHRGRRQGQSLKITAFKTQIW